MKPKEWSDFKRFRRSDAEIDDYYRAAVHFWDVMCQNFSALKDYSACKPGKEIAEPYRSRNGGHILFRPIGLLIVINVIVHLRSNGMKLEKAVEMVARAPVELARPPWVGLLWNGVQRRMLLSGPNKKVARWLLYYSVGGDMNKAKFQKLDLRKELAAIQNREIEEIELPSYTG